MDMVESTTWREDPMSYHSIKEYMRAIIMDMIGGMIAKRNPQRYYIFIVIFLSYIFFMFVFFQFIFYNSIQYKRRHEDENDGYDRRNDQSRRLSEVLFEISFIHHQI